MQYADGNLFDYSNTNDIKNVKELSIFDKNEILEKLKSVSVCDSTKTFLNIQAHILKLAYAQNKILSLSNSRTRILAHQVESTHIVVNSLNQRHILADEVGLGKTIEAGLVIKELIFRYAYKKIAIICPATLLFQWQNEMEEKFSEKFEIIDRKYLDKMRKENPLQNPWKNCGKIICSLDFIKNKKFLEEIENVKWDAVIFDEAHRLRRDEKNSTLAYNMAEIISKNSKALLLLTATPFRGKLEELYYFIRLVDKNLLGPFTDFYNRFCRVDSDLLELKNKLSDVLLRRTKKAIGGFTKRHAKTIQFELYSEERELYDATTRYVVEEFNRAIQTENRAVGFVMTVFQKLLDSSSFALVSALKNRKKNLQAMLDRSDEIFQLSERADDILHSIDEEFDVENEILDDYEKESIVRTVEELKEEIKTLSNLIILGEKVQRNKKAEKLKEIVARLKKNGTKKILIFTQFRTTQDYIKEMLSAYKVDVFNGSMTKFEKEDAIIDFENKTEILICTEAGGEGRNMQFCNVIINYDLPWSPLKIEQRIGRLHRFGQKYDVFIYNFSTKDTVAERILDVLNHKLNLFEESIGKPDVMLGQIEDELKLNSLFMKMNAGNIDQENVDKAVEESIEMAKKSFEKLDELTIAQHMDFNYDEYYKITQKDRKFSNNQLRDFALDYFSAVENDKKAIIPLKEKDIYAICDENDSLRRGTFNSEIALSNSKLEFLAFGHDIVDNVFESCCNDADFLKPGISIVNSDEDFKGIMFYFIAVFSAHEENSELLSVFISSDKISDIKIMDLEEAVLIQNSIKEIPEYISKEIEFIRYNSENLFVEAKNKIRSIVRDKSIEIREDLEMSVEPEIEKIENSFAKIKTELNERLERQKLQMINEERDMRSAITRTENMLKKAHQERDSVVAKYKRILNVSCTINLLNAIVVIGTKVID